MKIEELAEYLYEDLNGQITSIEKGDVIKIQFECDDWDGNDVIRKFVINCFDVEESDINVSKSEAMDFCKEHPLLMKYNEPQGELYYSSIAANKYEVLGRIYEAHELVASGWRPLSDHINTSYAGQHITFCEGSYGLLARGPQSLLNIYAASIKDLITTNYVSSFKPKGSFKALVFDHGFVICKSVEVSEMCS
ncbi:hypothetical protein V6450_004551 [Vibrio vulnificus]|nr:hypothetical protein [Vibrio vulnificus]ELX4140057.1 hypothetical protein [Vibrio vulnificus]